MKMILNREDIESILNWIWIYIKTVIGFVISPKFRELIAIVINTYKKAFNDIKTKLGMDVIMAIFTFLFFVILFCVSLMFI